MGLDEEEEKSPLVLMKHDKGEFLMLERGPEKGRGRPGQGGEEGGDLDQL